MKVELEISEKFTKEAAEAIKDSYQLRTSLKKENKNKYSIELKTTSQISDLFVEIIDQFELFEIPENEYKTLVSN